MKSLFLCALALVSTKRPDAVIGRLVARYEIYQTDRSEHCFEELGRTWIDDEVLSMIEVPMEMCE